MKNIEFPQEYLAIPFLSIDDVNTRIINHWEKENLIIDNRKEGKGWRKYSIIDLVWIGVIEKLRGFNFPLESIQIVSENLFKQKEKEYSLIEVLLDEYISKGYCNRVNIYCNGKIIDNKRDEIFESFDSFISLNLDNIIKKVLPNYFKTTVEQKSWQLKPNEIKLLNLIRCGNFKTINIETKAGEIKQINAEEILQDHNTFIDLVKEYDYQDIITSIRNGKVTRRKRVIMLRK